jgi:hypothetical protein
VPFFQNAWIYPPDKTLVIGNKPEIKVELASSPRLEIWPANARML